MEIYEITGYQTGVSKEGVNFLQPVDSFTKMFDGFIYRQVLQSREGFGYYCPRPIPTIGTFSRIRGIYEFIKNEGEAELLIFNSNQVFRFNTGTGIFDPIPFGGSIAGYGGFNITEQDTYISGTSYADKTNKSRFVFTFLEGTQTVNNSLIFFYDPVAFEIKDYINVVDNPEYVQPVVGTNSVVMNAAKYVYNFGERINFIYPLLANIPQPQMIIYSGIRNNSGSGDKFAVSGSGNVVLDTYDLITGADVLGNVLTIKCDRSAWAIDKTTDVFNPYFSRRLPGVLGSNADFSTVVWNDEDKCVGKTGFLSADGRRSLRMDNKVPFFTQDEMSALKFNYTYGGFDRDNNQFLWAYVSKDAEEFIDTQDKVVVYNYEEATWSIFNQRFSVFGQTNVGLSLNWNQIDETTTGNQSWARWNTTEEKWNKIGVGASVQKTLAGDDLGFIYELSEDFDDYYINITSITAGSTTTVNTGEQAFLAGDKVVVQNVAGMTQINNFDPETGLFVEGKGIYTVISATDVQVVINVDSTLFTAATPNTGTISKIIEFSAETIPFNPFRAEGRKVYVSHVEFLLDRGSFLKVSVFEDEDNAPFKIDIDCSTDLTSVKERQWITMTVDHEANFLTFILKHISPAAQFKLTSLRIHCDRGGYTSG